MRTYLMLGTAAFTLAACGGGAGPETAGSVAPPVVNGDAHSFVSPTVPKSYEAIGATQHFQYSTQSNRNYQSGQLYAGDANTVRDGGITIAYNPRDAIFELAISRPKAFTNSSTRFQDPLHRTAFGGQLEPQANVPPAAAERGILYLEAGSGSGSAASAGSNYPIGSPGYQSSVSTFFYQKPGTTTKYVTYGGFVQNTLSSAAVSDPQYNADGTPKLDATGKAVTVDYIVNKYDLARTVFTWGERTDNAAVPKAGTGTFTGDMLAVMIYNDRPDSDPTSPSYFQWITGSNRTVVDFAARTVNTTLTGTVSAPTLDAYTSAQYTLAPGTSFTATGSATIDLAKYGGFSGTFSDVRFSAPGLAADRVVNIAGSSLDGSFFGPGGEEVGAAFRIVGGTPDQRIDITGAFTGKR